METLLSVLAIEGGGKATNGGKTAVGVRFVEGDDVVSDEGFRRDVDDMLLLDRRFRSMGMSGDCSSTLFIISVVFRFEFAGDMLVFFAKNFGDEVEPGVLSAGEDDDSDNDDDEGRESWFRASFTAPIKFE